MKLSINQVTEYKRTFEAFGIYGMPQSQVAALIEHALLTVEEIVNVAPVAEATEEAPKPKKVKKGE